MFGDIGHGSLLFFVASILCLFSTCLNRFKFLFLPLKCRYIFLLMGFFATFSGFIYNDFVSVPLTFGTSCYNLNNGTRTNEDCVFKLGVDPAWLMSKYEL